MPSCYHCGVHLRNGEGYRRQVLTGESTRIYFSRRVGSSYGQSYGLRTLCHSCAKFLDERKRALSWQLPISVLVGLAGSAIAIKNGASVDSALGGLLFFIALLGGPGFLTFCILRAFQYTNSARHSDYGNSYPPVLENSSINERVSSLSAYAKTRAFEKEPEVDSNRRPPLSVEQVEAIKNAGARVEEHGISFFQCFGFATSNDNLPRLVEAIRISLPPSYYGNVTEWSDAIVKDAHNRFIKEFSLATNPINIERLVQIFPGKLNEETDIYMVRLLDTLKGILGGSRPSMWWK